MGPKREKREYIFVIKSIAGSGYFLSLSCFREYSVKKKNVSNRDRSDEFIVNIIYRSIITLFFFIFRLKISKNRVLAQFSV